MNSLMSCTPALRNASRLAVVWFGVTSIPLSHVELHNDLNIGYCFFYCSTAAFGGIT